MGDIGLHNYLNLHSYIRSKQFPEEIHYKLLDITRRDTIVEDLIDVIIENTIDMAEQNNCISKLNMEIQDLEHDLKKYSEDKEAVEALEANDQYIKNNFSKFLDEFQEKNKRYPSINEAWEAAWTCGLKTENNN